MLCPSCNGSISVLETINQQRATYRQKKCDVCGMKFYTKEEVASVDEAKPLFDEWIRERSRKCRAKKKGLEYEPTFQDGREQPVIPKKPTSPLF
jgi:transcription elongation factor Elf1